MKHYIYNIFIAIDKLGNAIGGGSHLNTISGRVGYFANVRGAAFVPVYWMLIQWFINIAFYPVDGYDHCYQTYLKERKVSNMRDYQRGTILALVILSLIVLVASIVIALILYPLKWLKIVEPN